MTGIGPATPDMPTTTHTRVTSIQFTFLHKVSWPHQRQGVWGMKTQNTGHLSHTL